MEINDDELSLYTCRLQHVGHMQVTYMASNRQVPDLDVGAKGYLPFQPLRDIIASS